MSTPSRYCPQCPHCRERRARAGLDTDLKLPGKPVATGVPGVNDTWYAAFARAYDVARTVKAQPRQALMDANPWMSTSQYGMYLKRARTLGFVRSAPRADLVPDTAEDAPAAATRQAGGRPRPRVPDPRPARPDFGMSAEALQRLQEEAGRKADAERELDRRLVELREVNATLTAADLLEMADGLLTAPQAAQRLADLVQAGWGTWEDEDTIRLRPRKAAFH